MNDSQYVDLTSSPATSNIINSVGERQSSTAGRETEANALGRASTHSAVRATRKIELTRRNRREWGHEKEPISFGPVRCVFGDLSGELGVNSVRIHGIFGTGIPFTQALSTYAHGLIASCEMLPKDASRLVNYFLVRSAEGCGRLQPTR